MIGKNQALSVVRQARALGISRGTVYYKARPASPADLKLMRRIDVLHLDYPFASSRMLKGLLKGEGHEVGCLNVATLMKKWLQIALENLPGEPQQIGQHVLDEV